MKKKYVMIALATTLGISPALGEPLNAQSPVSTAQSQESVSSSNRMILLFSVKPISSDTDPIALNHIDTLLAKIRHVRSLMSDSVNLELVTRTLFAIQVLHALALQSGGFETNITLGIGPIDEFPLGEDPDVRALRIWLSKKECSNDVWKRAQDITYRYRNKELNVDHMIDELTDLYKELLG